MAFPETTAAYPSAYALRCFKCEGADYPGLIHNPNAPYCIEHVCTCHERHPEDYVGPCDCSG